jgi:tRNA-binding EMAP/Myf-like protein
MDIITFDDFKKLDIRIGKILSAEKVEGSDKLMKLLVDFGPAPVAPEPVGEWIPAETDDKGEGRIKRQIIAGIAQFYAPEALIGKECPFAYNLAPRVLKGLESQGMILCPSDANGPVLMHPDKEITPGSIVK